MPYVVFGMLESDSLPEIPIRPASCVLLGNARPSVAIFLRRQGRSEGTKPRPLTAPSRSRGGGGGHVTFFNLVIVYMGASVGTR